MPLHHKKHSQKRRRTLIPAVILASFAATAGTGIFTFTLPLLNFDEKASGAWLGTAFAGYFLAKMIIAPISGRLSDRFGPKPLLVLAALLSALLPLLYFSINSIETLYTIQLGLGFTGGMIKTISMAIIGANSDTEKMPGRFSLLSSAFNAAFFIGPILGGMLYLDRDFSPVMAGVSIWMAFSLLLFIFAVPKRPSTGCKAARELNNIVKPGLTDRLTLFLSIAGRTAGIGALMTFYPVLLKTRLAINGVEAGLLFTVPNLTAFFLLPLAGRLFAGYNHRITAPLGMIISSAGLYLLTISHSVPAFVFFGIITGAGSAISIPASMTLSSGLGIRQGRSHGAANLAANIGFFAGPLIAGFAVKTSGSTEAAFQFAGFMGAALCLPLLGEGFARRFKCSHTAALKVRTGAASACIIILCLSPFFISGPSEQSENLENTYRFTDVAMGTVVNLTIEAGSSEQAEDAAKSAIQTMRSLQKDFDHRSRYGSIGTVNRHAGKKPTTVGEKAFGLIRRGLEYGNVTGGLFDISIGAVTTAPFYYALSETLLKSKKRLVDYRRVKLFPEKNKVFLPAPGMALDLGGLAKGTILDAAAQRLRESGIRTAMIEGGGDFSCFGERDWVIGLKDPRSSGLIGTIEVRNRSVCGSGDYYQFIISGESEDRKRRHHILDIKSMESATECIATTVVAPNAEKADALATSLFIMGPETGGRMLEKHYPKCSAMWVLPDMSIVKTANFPPISDPEPNIKTEEP